MPPRLYFKWTHAYNDGTVTCKLNGMGNGILTLCPLKTTLRGFVVRQYHLNATKFKSPSHSSFVIDCINVGFIDYFYIVLITLFLLFMNGEGLRGAFGSNMTKSLTFKVLLLISNKNSLIKINKNNKRIPRYTGGVLR